MLEINFKDAVITHVGAFNPELRIWYAITEEGEDYIQAISATLIAKGYHLTDKIIIEATDKQLIDSIIIVVDSVSKFTTGQMIKINSKVLTFNSTTLKWSFQA